MGTVRCLSCGADLHLHPSQRFPDSLYFDAGHKGSVSYASMDGSVIRLQEEEKLGPFFESSSSWGISRKRTVIYCKTCGAKLGVWMNDGPAQDGRIGQRGFGPSQVVPRVSRYRLWKKSIIEEPGAGAGKPL